MFLGGRKTEAMGLQMQQSIPFSSLENQLLLQFHMLSFNHLLVGSFHFFIVKDACITTLCLLVISNHFALDENDRTTLPSQCIYELVGTI